MAANLNLFVKTHYDGYVVKQVYTGIIFRRDAVNRTGGLYLDIPGLDGTHVADVEAAFDQIIDIPGRSESRVETIL
jgi:hypothetical protein